MGTDTGAEATGKGLGTNAADMVAEATDVKDSYAAPDGGLVALVATTDRAESFEIGVTLLVSGVVVTGILVSGGRYFDLLADWLTEQGEQEFGEGFARFAAQVFRDSRDNGDEATPGYIHLRDAQVFLTASERPLPKTLWRGRLSHVSAWSVGSLSQERHDAPAGAIQP